MKSKALNDSIAAALGIDDDRFLPCARSKVSGLKGDDIGITVEIANV